MPPSTSDRAWREARDGKRVFALWMGVLMGPIAWLTLLEVNYVLSYVACETRQTWFLHLTTAMAIAATAAAGLAAWRAGRGSEGLDEPLTPPVSAATSDARARWMAHAAAASSVWFIVVMIAMIVPVVTLRTCQ